MSLTDRPPIPFQRSPNRFPVLRRRFHYSFLDLLLNEPFRQSSQLLRVAPVPAPLKLKLVAGFNISHHNGQPLLVNIDSRNPIGHRLPPGGNGERAGLTLTWVAGYRRSARGQRTIYSLDHARSGSNLHSA